MHKGLEQAINDKSAKVGVVGLGYVGLPLINAFASAGFKTIGYDVDRNKVDMLLAGESFIEQGMTEEYSGLLYGLPSKKQDAELEQSQLR